MLEHTQSLHLYEVQDESDVDEAFANLRRHILAELEDADDVQITVQVDGKRHGAAIEKWLEGMVQHMSTEPTDADNHRVQR